jgi:tRNA (guanosine-2'-O-)-methyltransferase
VAPLNRLETEANQALIEYLQTFITPDRLTKINAVLAHRTRYVTVALENIHFAQNASAVLRNCDNFGIQDIHIIENTANFKLHRDVTRGCSKWLTLHHYATQAGNTQRCIARLKAQGYRIVATTPHTESCILPDLAIDRPLALLFGNEQDGLSRTALSQADLKLRIPLYGFSESFNISVSTALCLQVICDRIRQSTLNWQLSAPEQQALQLDWYRQSVNASQSLEKRFWQQQQG